MKQAQHIYTYVLTQSIVQLEKTPVQNALATLLLWLTVD